MEQYTRKERYFSQKDAPGLSGTLIIAKENNNSSRVFPHLRIKLLHSCMHYFNKVR